MVPLLGCVIAFGICFWLGLRSLVKGLVAVLTVGYLYGIVRAHFSSEAAHFLFDSGVLGLYCSQILSMWKADEARLTYIRKWIVVLIGWPIVVCLLPFQPVLVSLVGLRASVFF